MSSRSSVRPGTSTKRSQTGCRSRREPPARTRASARSSMPVSRRWRSGSQVLMSSSTRSIVVELGVGEPVAEVAVGVERGVDAHLLAPRRAASRAKRCCISGSPPLSVKPPDMTFRPWRYFRSSSVARATRDRNAVASSSRCRGCGSRGSATCSRSSTRRRARRGRRPWSRS